MAFLIAVIGFDFFYDDSYDGLASNLSTGQFSPFSLFDWHFLGLLWIKEPLKFIQNIFIDIDVFYSFYIFCVLFSSVYLYYTFEKIADKLNTTLKLILKISFLLIIVDSLIFVTHTRFATLFTGLSLLNLVLFQGSTKLKTLSHILIFLFGFLVRPESGIGSMIFVFSGLFLFGCNYIRLIKVALLPILCSIAFFTTLYVYKNYTNRLEILIEPDIEYAMSTDKFKPFTGGNKIDSIRYEFARNAFFIDTSFVDDQYLQTIISKTNTIDYKSYLKSANHVLKFYVSYSIASFALLFILLSLLLSKNYQTFIRALIYNLGLFFIFTILDYQVNIADRHFSALILLSLFVSAVFFEKSVANQQLKFINIAFVFLLIFPINYTWNYISQNDKHVQKNVQYNIQVLDKLEKKIHGRNIIVTVSGFKLFDKPYSFITSKRTKNNYYIYDLSTYSIVPRYTSYLSSKCNCSASVPLSFFLWLEKTNAILIIDEKRTLVLKNYFKVRYHKEIEFYSEKSLDQILDIKIWPNLKFKRVRFLKSIEGF